MLADLEVAPPRQFGTIVSARISRLDSGIKPTRTSLQKTLKTKSKPTIS